jgi:hypothetical protein
VFGAVAPGAHGLFWNEDGFDLPPGADALAAPSGGSCAAFRLGAAAAWGVQFHPELSVAELDDWYARWGALLDEAGLAEADARRADAQHLAEQAALSAAIFGGFARRCGAGQPAASAASASAPSTPASSPSAGGTSGGVAT